MELEFIPERLRLILKLKGITSYSLRTKTGINVDAWIHAPRKHSIDRVKLIAKELNVPVGFFYYKNIEVNFSRELMVEIFIVDTSERVTFNFLPDEEI